MNYSPIYSRGPVIRTERLTLWEQVQVAGATRMISFDRDIVWLRQSETQMVLEHRGAEVASLCTLSDFYGFLSCLEHSCKEAKRFREQYKIKSGDALKIMALTTVADRPVVADTSDEAVNRNATSEVKQYRWVDRDWFTSEHFSKETGWSRLEPVEVDSLRVDVTDGKLGTATQLWIEKMRNGVSANA